MYAYVLLNTYMRIYVYVCIQRCAKHCRQPMKNVNCDSEIEIVARSRYSVYIAQERSSLFARCASGAQEGGRARDRHHNMYHSYI